jgi:acyl-CoA synthetase (AMP-forming)/AMP-acid ligase II
LTSPLLAALDAFGPRTALIDDERQWTFAALRDEVLRLAAALTIELPRGARAVVFMANRAEHVLLQCACELAGVVRVPLNARYSAVELANVVSDCNASVVFFDEVTSPHVVELVDAPWLCSVAGDRADNGPTWKQLLAGEAPRRPLGIDDLDGLASINYTSGTLTAPKGVMLSHRAWRSVYKNMLIDRDIRTDDVLAHVGPLTHASGAYLMPFLLRGATNVIVKGGRVDDLLPTIERHRVTSFSCVPTVLTRLVNDDTDHDVSSLRWIAYGAEPIPANTLRAALGRFGPILTQNYGLTEAMMTCAYNRHAEVVAANGEYVDIAPVASCIGRPYTFVELVVRDDEGRPVADGEVGQLTIRAEHVMSGYWNRPEQTAEVLRDGWLWSGDLARREEGRFYLAGRSKDMLISGGFNIYPSEIEQCIAECHGVREAAVVGVEDPNFGESAVAFVVVNPHAQVSPQTLRDSLHPTLGYKTPRHWRIVTELPRTENGKINKAALKAGLANMNGTAAATPAEPVDQAQA